MNTAPSEPTVSPQPPDGTEPLSLYAFLASLLDNLRLLVGLPLVLMVLAAGITLLRGAEYVSESKFTPNTTRGGSAGLAALAAQFGISSGMSDNGPPIDFYAELLRSQEFLGEVAGSTFTLASVPPRFGAFTGDLAACFRTPGATAQERLRRTVEELRKSITIRKDAPANLVVLRVRADRPDLAELINRRLLENIDIFNREKRRSQTLAERRFVEERMAASYDSLVEAEARLRDFLEQNVGYENSPTLRLESSRLQRRVDQRQQIYLSLSQAYEEARIDEVRDTPVVTIVDRPEGWVQRERGLIKNGLLAFLFGLFAAGAIVVLRDFLAGQRRTDPEAFRRFRNRRRDLLTGSGRPPAAPPA